MRGRAGQLLPSVLASSPLVCAVGENLTAEVESHPDPTHIDHVRIRMDVGRSVRLLVSINTQSRRNLTAGFDPRVRAAVFTEAWETLPELGIRPLERFDYSEVEAQRNLFYEHRTRPDLEKALVHRVSRALRLEAWGTPYLNRGPGIHQIHSRRASCAVWEDIAGRDGGLRFYFEDRVSETWFFKFCGQP